MLWWGWNRINCRSHSSVDEACVETCCSHVHRKKNTLLSSWKNCTGCQWDSELIPRSCPWHTDARKVRCRGTSRNSFFVTFLHDLIIHHHSHAYGLKCCWKTHEKTQFGSELALSQLSSSGTPYHNQSGKQNPVWSSADVSKPTCFLNETPTPIFKKNEKFRSFLIFLKSFF